MSPEVSIVISNFNYGKYLPECLDSCIDQTFKDFEIIVVDDCSTDNSYEVLEAYQEADQRLVYFGHQTNRGYAAAKNTGVRFARGNFIRMLDADDRLVPTALEDALEVFRQKPDVSLVHGIALRWYGGTDTRGYNKKTYVHAQGRMWRRSVYERFGLYYEPLRSMADKEFVYRLGVHPDSPLPRLVKDVRIKKVVAWYRKHKQAMHKVRRLKPIYNAQIKNTFKKRIKQLKIEGITHDNTAYP